MVDQVRAELARRKVPRWLMWAGVGVGVVLLLLTVRALFFGGDERAEYATVALERRDLLVTVNATGNLQPTVQVDVGSETSGIITEVYVDNNDRVIKGQVLARVDTERLVDSLRQAQAGLASAKAQLATNDASLALARAQLKRLEEVRQLSNGQVPSDAELDNGRAEYRRAVAQVDSARASVRQAEAQVSSARISLDRATIYSPVTGIVLSRKVDPGQTVAAQFQTPELFVIAQDLSQMRLDVDVDEADIGRVTTGQTAQFTVDAFPGKSFPAKVQRVDVGANNGTASDTATATSGEVVSYVARLSVANPDGQLRPGMTAVATIAAQRYRNALIVPLPALRFQPPKAAEATKLSVRPPSQSGPSTQQSRIGAGSQQTVHVLGNDNTLRAIRVRTVAISGNEAAVEGKDLRPGMRIVTGLLKTDEAQ
jgi:HlyD family secretion protein